jgi:uncharacterized protein YrrD
MNPQNNVSLLSLAAGFRTSKVVGSTVVNESEETVGTVDDLIIVPQGNVPVAVLSVGGFLGIGSKYVVMPYSAFETQGKTLLLRNVTKDALMHLPEYTYSD